MKAAKFRVGDRVRFSKPDLYGMLNGTIIEVEKVYSELDASGKLRRGGLNILETDISNTVLPYTLEGDVLSITYPSGEVYQYRLNHWAYTSENSKMSTLYPERMLKLM